MNEMSDTTKHIEQLVEAFARKVGALMVEVATQKKRADDAEALVAELRQRDERIAQLEQGVVRLKEEAKEICWRWEIASLDARRERDTAKAALGRACAALRETLIPLKALQLADGRNWSAEVTEQFARAEPMALAILADPMCQSAGKAWAEAVEDMRERCATLVEWASLDWDHGDPRKTIAAAIRAQAIAAVDARKACKALDSYTREPCTKPETPGKLFCDEHRGVDEGHGLCSELHEAATEAVKFYQNQGAIELGRLSRAIAAVDARKAGA